MDETYVKVKGVWKYLYRAVDKADATVNFLLTAKRDRSCRGGNRASEAADSVSVASRHNVQLRLRATRSRDAPATTPTVPAWFTRVLGGVGLGVET